MKKLLTLVVAGLLILTACSNNATAPKKEKTVEAEKNIIQPSTTKNNEVQDVIDPIQEGDIKTERKSFEELKPKMYEALENTYDPNAKHNKDADQAFLKASKGIDKLTLDSSFESMEKIVSLCESENRYFKKSEMDLMAFNAKQIEELSNKWTKFTNAKEEDPKAVQKNQAPEKVKPEKKEETFKEKAEKNAKEHAAGPGKVLVTKGNFHFTGLPYYFKGELLEIGSSEAFNNKNIWLIKNDKGYVMPVEMYEGETANPGDVVEVWGTLSGEGYTFPNVDNVVKETGYLITVQYTLNGEINN